MDVLISWSGQQSHSVGIALYEWLKEVIPGIQPWISSEDIAPGTRWVTPLMGQLDSCNLCIICMTPENVRSPWLYFEAGAIAGRRNDPRVYSYLIGVPGSELGAGPLSQFQWIEADRGGTWKLIRDINKSLNAPHNEAVLEGNFSHKWPSFKRKLEKAVEEYDPKPTDLVGQTKALKPVYQLSSEAKQLIIEAAADRHGTVMMVRSSEGRNIQTNGKQMAERGNARSEAAWQAAVRELLHNGLLQSLGHEGEIFEVTAEGYRIADELREKSTATAP